MLELILNMILFKEPIATIYKILCIQSLASHGLEEKTYDTVKKEIVESYGYSQLLIFTKLENCGFIRKKDKRKKGEKSVYEQLKKPLNLWRSIPEGTDPALVNLPYDAYVPLSFKLFELAILEGWRNSQLLNAIPGVTEVHGNPQLAMSNQSSKKTILVYMVGGITFAEVSYMRKLAAKANIDLLIATTDIITSDDMVGPFLAELAV